MLPAGSRTKKVSRTHSCSPKLSTIIENKRVQSDRVLPSLQTEAGTNRLTQQTRWLNTIPLRFKAGVIDPCKSA